MLLGFLAVELLLLCVLIVADAVLSVVFRRRRRQPPIVKVALHLCDLVQLEVRVDARDSALSGGAMLAGSRVGRCTALIGALPCLSFRPASADSLAYSGDACSHVSIPNASLHAHTCAVGGSPGRTELLFYFELGWL